MKNERFATITLESVLAGDRIAYAVENMASETPDLVLGVFDCHLQAYQGKLSECVGASEIACGL